MRKYARYKDSGISWIGDVPEHWDVVRNKNFIDEKDEVVGEKFRDYTLLSLTKGGVIARDVESGKGKFPKDFESYKIVQPGNVIFCLFDVDETPRTVGLSSLRGMITGAYDVFEPININARYYAYYFLAVDDRKALRPLYTGLRKVVKKDRFLACKIPVPPLSEQKAIAEYLDKKTAQINELVSAKQKQIELLKEYKQSVIANAVTGKLNKNCRMKDSGISWIGKIPENWECSTLRKHLTFVSDKGHPNEQLLSVTREQGVIIRNTESKEENHNVIPLDLSDYKLVKQGQFAINKMKSWQGSYGVSSYTGIVSPAYYVCDLDFENKNFFSIAIRSKAYIPFFTMYSKGIRVDQWDLSPIGLKTIPFFIPPTDEQDKIVSFVKDKMERIDSQIASIEEQIVNLNEYKQSLISDVVTGKVKV